MTFINKLKPTNDSIKISQVMPFDENITFRIFKGIQVNDDLWISIQASYGHYCNPRKTLKDLSEYNSMEFALRDKEGNFLSVTDVLPNFPKLKEIEEYYEDTVYGYVPVNLIEDLVQVLSI
ncbi:hypothetical protein CJ195_22310 [Bacillus sp. UMB0899]|nr:hypothetical protein CJ195_22310 [Bacillus sp. UMB0899]